MSTLTFQNSEVTIQNPGSVVSINTTWESSIGSRIADSIYSIDDAISLFKYSEVAPIQNGSESESLYQFGIDGVARDGKIGSLSFFEAALSDVSVTGKVCGPQYPSINYWKFWDYISTFWNLKSEDLTNWFEAFWTTLSEVNHKILLYAGRYRSVINQEKAQTEVYDYMSSVDIGVLNSTPIPLDPISGSIKYLIIPAGSVVALPPNANVETGDLEYVNYIPVSESAYSAIYDLFQDGVDKYAVVVIKGDDEKRFYKIHSIVSSLTGDYNPQSTQNNAYALEIHSNLGELLNKDISFYITTGLSYNIDPNIEDIGYLRIINADTKEDQYFEKGIDFDVRDGFIEFNVRPEYSGAVYCDYVAIKDQYLYEAYGNMVGINGWSGYNHSNTSGKTAINSTMLGLQTPDRADEAINALYGAPIAADSGTVVGLFESYGYEIVSVTEVGSTPSGIEYDIALKVPGKLSYMFYDGGQILSETANEILNIKRVINRDSGVIRIIVAGSQVVPAILGVVYPRLINKYSVVGYTDETADTPAQITIQFEQGHDAIQSLINFVQSMNEFRKYPEIILYNSPYNGIHHITAVGRNQNNAGNVDISLFKHVNDFINEYNDYVGYEDIPNDSGVAHIPWLTHKFLLVNHGGCKYERYYIDSNMDTLYEAGDTVSMYDLLTTNVNKFDWESFPNWGRFINFDLYNDHDEKYGALFITAENHGSSAGEYIPVDFKTYTDRR